MQELRGRVAVVTGAASGIGRALAERFAAEGMKVVLADVEPGALADAAHALARAGAETLAVETDVSRAEQVEALARRTLDAFGAVHVVCNNAGVFAGGPCWEAPLADYEWLLGVNVWGVIHGIRSFVPILLEQGDEGHVVNTASMAAVTTLPSTRASTT
jgi:NAD(P)-dependent dehydrogenase (short-subunit alcohol dehydrogenase family)